MGIDLIFRQKLQHNVYHFDIIEHLPKSEFYQGDRTVGYIIVNLFKEYYCIHGEFADSDTIKVLTQTATELAQSIQNIL